MYKNISILLIEDSPAYVAAIIGMLRATEYSSAKVIVKSSTADTEMLFSEDWNSIAVVLLGLEIGSTKGMGNLQKLAHTFTKSTIIVLEHRVDHTLG
jgi:DNA-binding response OmpR family regulator